MRAIFISYRRDDTEGYAGRLFRDLRERFGKDAVFMDVAGIEPGRDFRRVIEDQVASCGVLLAVIGKAWLTAADAHGKRRLDDPNDFVRLETASALKRDIPVIPVLVQQTEMLREDQLPEGLKDLAFRNSVELTHARWESDVELLIAALQRYVDPSTAGAAAAAPAAASAQPTSRHQAWVIAPLATLALGGIAYVAWDRFGPGSEGTKDAASDGTRIAAASATGGVVAPPPASAAAALPAAAAAPPSAAAAVPVQASASAPAPAAPQAPAPAAVDADAARKTATNQAAPASSARRVDRPVAAKAPVAAPVASRPPAPAPMPAVPKVAVTTATATPAPSLPMEPPAAASPAPAPVVTAAAPAPAPEVAPTRHDRSLELLGMSGAASTVTRTIVIKPEMSYVNVTWGDVVRFEVGDKSFIWNFNGTRNSFDLAQVAPPEVLSRKVTAYVAPNPSFRRR